MRRGRTLILILLILIIGLLVGFVAVRQFLAAQQRVDQPVYVSIYFAAQNIPQGAPITEDVLGTMQIPQENVVATMYTVDERALLLTKAAKYPIDQGTPLTEALVTDSSSSVPTSGPQWAAQIPVGMTAISIPTDRLAVAGYAINDGARININACFLFVDVDPSYQTILPNLTAIVTGTSAADGSLGGFEGTGFSSEGLPILSLGVAGSGTPHGRFELDPAVQQPYYVTPSEAQRPRTVCQMILQNVTVMKLGNFPLSGALQSPAQPGDQQQQPQQTSPNAPAPDIITLIVTPQDAITLTYLTYTNARISMTLRNPSDDARVPTEASTLQFLLSQYNIPVPAKLPYAMHPSLDALTSPSLPNDAVTVPSE